MHILNSEDEYIHEKVPDLIQLLYTLFTIAFNLTNATYTNIQIKY